MVKIEAQEGFVMWSNIAYFATLMFESVIGIFGIRLYEEPHYDVISRLNNRVEIRRYSSRLAVETELSNNGKETMSDAFRLLFSYIAGANQAPDEVSLKIAMTVPVEVIVNKNIAMTTPVQVSQDVNTVRMRFYLPAKFNELTAPIPTNNLVRIIKVPAETIATLRYSGSTEGSKSRETELIEALKETQWMPYGKTYLLGYDSPFSLPFLRRNEVAVAVTVKQ